MKVIVLFIALVLLIASNFQLFNNSLFSTHYSATYSAVSREYDEYAANHDFVPINQKFLGKTTGENLKFFHKTHISTSNAFINAFLLQLLITLIVLVLLLVSAKEQLTNNKTSKDKT
ncbi:hypothetical protein AAEX28_13535 [Lentisphaerota bacterium WC36G]|nr:hypothetical protein LJT99_00290 [Lentisphaerae bacterium WC36]